MDELGSLRNPWLWAAGAIALIGITLVDAPRRRAPSEPEDGSSRLGQEAPRFRTKPRHRRPAQRMSEARAFVSFDFDHNESSRNLFVGQAKNDSPTPFVVQDWSSKSNLPEDEWEDLIASKIGACHLMIVLVGRSMGSAYGVAVEIAIAKDKNVPFFGVYVDGAGTSSTLPSGLAQNRIIAWTWEGVGAAIDQMMGEGKNRK